MITTFVPNIQRWLTAVATALLLGACLDGGSKSDSDAAGADGPAGSGAGQASGAGTEGGVGPADQRTPDTLGGQSGGQSGTSTVSDLDCYCGFSFYARARVVTPNARGFCAVFELIDKPEGVDEYFGLEPGDLFGGSGHLLCQLGLDVEAGSEVAVRYTPDEQSADGCPERAACIDEECLPTMDIDALDACLDACERRAAAQCTAYGDVARFSGQVEVAALLDEDRVVFNQEGSPFGANLAELVGWRCAAEPEAVVADTPGAPPPSREDPMYDDAGAPIDFYDAPPDACDVPE